MEAFLQVAYKVELDDHKALAASPKIYQNYLIGRY